MRENLHTKLRLSHISCQTFPMRRILTSVVLLVLLFPALALGETMTKFELNQVAACCWVRLFVWYLELFGLSLLFLFCSILLLLCGVVPTKLRLKTSVLSMVIFIRTFSEEVMSEWCLLCVSSASFLSPTSYSVVEDDADG